MATKTIKVPVTLHQAGKANKPFKYDNNGAVIEGKYDYIEVAPNTPVPVDADEADALLARYGGEEVKAEAAPAPAK
jgi:hypothetical protein